LETREALFWAALQRETMRLLEDLVNQLSEDAELALPHRLMPAIFVEVLRRPLVKAVLLSDAEVLGALASDESVAAAQRELAGNPDYLGLLGQARAAAGRLDEHVGRSHPGQRHSRVLRRPGRGHALRSRQDAVGRSRTRRCTA
jgi:hypothetical protein